MGLVRQKWSIFEKKKKSTLKISIWQGLIAAYSLFHRYVISPSWCRTQGIIVVPSAPISSSSSFFQSWASCVKVCGKGCQFILQVSCNNKIGRERSQLMLMGSKFVLALSLLKSIFLSNSWACSLQTQHQQTSIDCWTRSHNCVHPNLAKCPLFYINQSGSPSFIKPWLIHWMDLWHQICSTGLFLSDPVTTQLSARKM